MAKRTGVDFTTVRQLMLSFPGVVEGTSFGTPGFRARNKLLARLREDGDTLILTSEDRDALLESDPETFYVTPHYQDYPRVLIRLSRVDREVLRSLIEKAWRLAASARQVKEFESGSFQAPKIKDLPKKPVLKVISGAERERHLARTRRICLELPEVEEKEAWSAPTFRVSGKMFAMFVSGHHGDGRIALWLSAEPGVQAMLVDAAPEKFFVPPYQGKQGWIGVHLDRNDDGEIRFHMTQAYRRVASPRLVAALESILKTKPSD